MNRYITFTDNARKEIDKCFALAEDIYGGNYDDVRILAGNFAGYGRYAAHYIAKSKLIEVPLHNTFSTVKLTSAGIEINDLELFKGLILHELGHHWVHYILPKNKRLTARLKTLTAGHSTHTNPAWCYVCAKGWRYFDPKIGTTATRLARGIRKKVPGLAAAMAEYDPYKPPYEILQAIPKEDGYTNICEYCGKTFPSSRPDAKFCSPRCRVASGRKSKKEVER